MSREVMQQALDALRVLGSSCNAYLGPSEWAQSGASDAEVALAEDLAKPDGPVARWIRVADRLPPAYTEAILKRAGGWQSIGRLNHAGNWQIASFAAASRHQYLIGDVVAWLEVIDPASDAERAATLAQGG